MSSLPLTLLAPAKINLYLHVMDRREDGYHILDSLVVFANDCADILTLKPASVFTVTFSGAFANGLDPNDNLVTKAAALYSIQTGQPLPFHINVEKNIPVGAGLGGGSSDAAATIRLLEQFYGVLLPEPSALLKLGADVPVCYFGKTCRMQGIGEIMTPVPDLPPLTLLLIYPNIHSVTKDIFTNLKIQNHSASAGAFTIETLLNQKNDLEETAMELYPAIAQAKEFMATQNGCRLTRMSGSGSCVFGIFDTIENAQNAAAAVPNNWWKKILKL